MIALPTIRPSTAPPNGCPLFNPGVDTGSLMDPLFAIPTNDPIMWKPNLLYP
jgi:hypothetical protein